MDINNNFIVIDSTANTLDGWNVISIKENVLLLNKGDDTKVMNIEKVVKISDDEYSISNSNFTILIRIK